MIQVHFSEEPMQHNTDQFGSDQLGSVQSLECSCILSGGISQTRPNQTSRGERDASGQWPDRCHNPTFGRDPFFKAHLLEALSHFHFPASQYFHSEQCARMNSVDHWWIFGWLKVGTKKLSS